MSTALTSTGLLASSESYEHAKHGLEGHGITVKDVSIDIKKMLDRKDAIVSKMTQSIEFLFRKNKITWWNILGAVLWIGSIGMVGVLLGGVEFIHNNIEMLAVIIVLVSVLPVTFEYLRGRSKAKGEAAE